MNPSFELSHSYFPGVVIISHHIYLQGIRDMIPKQRVYT